MKARPRRLLNAAAVEAYSWLVSELEGQLRSTVEASLEDAQMVARRKQAVTELRTLAREPRGYLSGLGRLPHPSAPLAENPRISPFLGTGQPTSRSAGQSPELIGLLVAKLQETDVPNLLKPYRLDLRQAVAFLLEILDISRLRRGESALTRASHPRGGLFAELAIVFHEDVLKAESKAAQANADYWIRTEPGRFGASDNTVAAVSQGVAEKIAAALETSTADEISSASNQVAVWNGRRVGPNLWLARLSGLFDENGKQVADHYRALLSFDEGTKVVDVMPVSLGESKFKRGRYKIVRQMISTFRRTQKSFSTADVPTAGEADVRTRWGPRVVAVLQSEEPPAPAHLIDIENAIKQAAKRPKLDVELVEIPAATVAKDARAIVRATMEILMSAPKKQ